MAVNKNIAKQRFVVLKKTEQIKEIKKQIKKKLDFFFLICADSTRSNWAHEDENQAVLSPLNRAPDS